MADTHEIQPARDEAHASDLLAHAMMAGRAALSFELAAERHWSEARRNLPFAAPEGKLITAVPAHPMAGLSVCLKNNDGEYDLSLLVSASIRSPKGSPVSGEGIVLRDSYFVPLFPGRSLEIDPDDRGKIWIYNDERSARVLFYPDLVVLKVADAKQVMQRYVS